MCRVAALKQCEEEGESAEEGRDPHDGIKCEDLPSDDKNPQEHEADGYFERYDAENVEEEICLCELRLSTLACSPSNVFKKPFQSSNSVLARQDQRR